MSSKSFSVRAREGLREIAPGYYADGHGGSLLTEDFFSKLVKKEPPKKRTQKIVAACGPKRKCQIRQENYRGGGRNYAKMSR